MRPIQAIGPMWPMHLANAGDGVLRRVAVPPRRDAAEVLWPPLRGANSLALGASGKEVWRATAGPGHALQIVCQSQGRRLFSAGDF